MMGKHANGSNSFFFGQKRRNMRWVVRRRPNYVGTPTSTPLEPHPLIFASKEILIYCISTLKFLSIYVYIKREAYGNSKNTHAWGYDNSPFPWFFGLMVWKFLKCPCLRLWQLSISLVFWSYSPFISQSSASYAFLIFQTVQLLSFASCFFGLLRVSFTTLCTCSCFNSLPSFLSCSSF